MELGIYMVGIGGHGLQQVGKTLAVTAWENGYQVTYSPKYEPAKRGGLSSAYVVISDEPIGNPRKKKNDILVMMDPEGYKRFNTYIKDDGLMIVNSSMVKEPPIEGVGYKRVEMPLSDIANETGSTKTISAVLLGVMSQVLPGFYSDSQKLLDNMLGKLKIDDAVKEMNRRAFEAGSDAFTAASK